MCPGGAWIASFSSIEKPSSMCQSSEFTSRKISHFTKQGIVKHARLPNRMPKIGSFRFYERGYSQNKCGLILKLNCTIYGTVAELDLIEPI